MPMRNASVLTGISCPPLTTPVVEPACAAHWPPGQATPPGDTRPGVYIVNLFKGQRHRDQQRWLEYYLLLGATHFVMVDNNCKQQAAEQATQTLAPYVDRGLVTHVTGFRCAAMPDVTLDNLLKRGCEPDERAPPFASCELCRTDILGNSEINGLPINAYRKRHMSPKSAALSCALSQVTGLRSAHRSSLVLLADDDEYVILRSPQYRLPDLASMLVSHGKCALPILWRQYGSSGHQCQPPGGNQLKHFMKRAPAVSEVTSDEERSKLDRQKRMASRMNLNQPVKGKTVFLASAMGCSTHVCTSCPKGLACGHGDDAVCPSAEAGFEAASNMSFDRDVWIAHYSYQSDQHFAAKIERGRTNDNGARHMPTPAMARYYNTVHDSRPWRILNARIHGVQTKELRTCLSSLFETGPKPDTSWMDQADSTLAPAAAKASDHNGHDAGREEHSSQVARDDGQPPSQHHSANACAMANTKLLDAVGDVETSPDPFIIAAGEGTTATRSLAEALGELGIWSAHNGRLFSPPGTKKAVHAKVQVELQDLLRPLYTKPPDENSGYKFAQLAENKWGAIMDTPVPIYLPWLLKAFPRARVILTVRDPMQWAKSRWDNHEFSPAPLHGLYHGVGYEPNKFATVTVKQHQTDASIRKGSERETASAGKLHQVATAFAMYNTFVACAVRPPQSFLLLDIFSGCSEQLWGQITTFLGLNVDVSKLPPFPGGSLPCKPFGKASKKLAAKPKQAATGSSLDAQRRAKRLAAAPQAAPAHEWLAFGRTILLVHVSGAGGTSVVAWARQSGLRVPVGSESINANEACGDDAVPNAHHYGWAGVISNTPRCSCEGEVGMRDAGFNFWASEGIVRAPLRCPKTDYWIVLRWPVSRIISRLTKLDHSGKGIPLHMVIESLKNTTRFAAQEYGKSEFSGTPSFNDWLVRSLVGPAAYDLPLGGLDSSHLEDAMRVLDDFSVVIPLPNMTMLPRIISARYGRCIKVPVPSFGGAKTQYEKPISRRRTDPDEPRLHGTSTQDVTNAMATKEARRAARAASKRRKSELKGKGARRSSGSSKEIRPIAAARRLAEQTSPHSKKTARKLDEAQLKELAALLLANNRLDEQLYMYGRALFESRWAATRDPCVGAAAG